MADKAKKEYSGPRATQLINAWAAGDREAAADVLEILEHELRRIAESAVRKDDRMQGVIDPGDLFGQLFLKLEQQFRNNGGVFERTERFLGLAHQVMRNFLLDESKRGGAAVPARREIRTISWIDREKPGQARAVNAADLYDALDRLTARSPELGRAMRAHYLEQRTLKELAAETGASTATIKRRLAVARQWMQKQLGG